ncbi:hypothetical protein CERSUDRAFT_108184 [Gelatoporia subvermispora B]|uniref:Uncharacterized protein n=1 Tax=Ceriporiopsis subvermispora (strain B) TaxID=914234 RepID=M2R3C4_CERS8|nr:hypothetical protein CERSUDRAFT_108184 [Gelatoporia subvermispora B]
MQLQQMQQMHMQQAHMQVPVQLSLQGMPHDSPVLQHPIPMRPAQMDQAHMLPGDVPGSTAGTLVPIAYGQQAYFPATPVPPDLAEALHAIAEANVVLQNLAREIDEDLRRMCALLVEDFRITLMDSETHIVPEGELQEHCRLLGAAEALVQHVQRAFGTAVRFIEPDDIRKTISLIMRVAHQRYLLTQDPPCYSIALASMPIFLESLQLRTLFLDATVAAAITPNVLAHMAPFELDAETSFARPGQDGVPIPPQPGAGLARPVTPSQFDALLTMANEDAEDVKPIIKAEDDIE